MFKIRLIDSVGTVSIMNSYQKTAYFSLYGIHVFFKTKARLLCLVDKACVSHFNLIDKYPGD